MKLTPTYIDGVLLALNAMPSVTAIIDAHRCYLERSWAFSALNDWRGGTAASGPYERDARLLSPNLGHARLVLGSEPLLEHYVDLLARRYPQKPVMLVASTLSFLAGTDLDGLARDLSERQGRPVIAVEREVTDEDWIDGWRRVEKAWFDYLGGSETPVGNVAVAGFGLFRLEQDEMANMDEIARIASMLGLPPLTWIVGRADTPHLSRRQKVVAFPFVAPELMENHQGDIVRVDLPIGVENTRGFVHALARGLEGTVDPEEVVASEIAWLAPRLDTFVANCLGGRGACVVGDPWFVKAACDACTEMGLGVELALVLRRGNASELDELGLEGIPAARYIVDPSHEQAWQLLDELAAEGLCDVVVGSGVLRDEAELCGMAYVEVTAPYQLEHFAMPSPYMGFRGMLNLAQRISNAVLQKEHSNNVNRHRRKYGRITRDNR